MRGTHVGLAWDWDQHMCALTVESLLTLSLLTCAESVDMVFLWLDLLNRVEMWDMR